MLQLPFIACWKISLNFFILSLFTFLAFLSLKAVTIKLEYFLIKHL